MDSEAFDPRLFLGTIHAHTPYKNLVAAQSISAKSL